MMLSLRKKVDTKHPHNRKQRMISGKHFQDDNSSISIQKSNTNSMTDSRMILTDNTKDSKAFLENEQNNFADFDNSFSTFNILFEQLKDNDPEIKHNAATELETLLISIGRELSVENFQRFSNGLNNKIFELIHGSTSNEKIGGVLAVDVLISYYALTEELPNQTARLANYLRMLIPSNDIEVMRFAAKTLGRLAIPGNILISEFVEGEVKICLEWLSSLPENNTNIKQEYKKHAALLVLVSLADNSTYLLYPHVDSVLDNIWRALRDDKLAIRIDAARLLRKCLEILLERNLDDSVEHWMSRLFLECQEGLKINTTQAVHATLLTYGELLKVPNKHFLKSHIVNIFKICMSLKNHKLDIIRSEVYTVLPLLASSDEERFTKRYLDTIMTYYLTLLRNMNINSSFTADKPAIYISIGNIASRVNYHIQPYTRQILDNLRENLKSKFRVRRYYEKQLFFCISKLGDAMGPALAKHLNRDILTSILSCPLSDYMEDTLKQLIKNIPAIETTVNRRLLTLFSFYLSGEKFSNIEKHSFRKTEVLKRAQIWRTKNIFNKNEEPKDNIKDARIIEQSLRMVNEIKCSNSLLKFASEIVACYIEHDVAAVRKAATLTTIALFRREIERKPNSFELSKCIANVLDTILIVALTDPIADIRLETLNNLSPTFDSQLNQPENLRLLIALSKDEVFDIQKETISLLGKLSVLNSAYCVPLLRKLTLELMTELEFAQWPRKKEECIILLRLLNNKNKDISLPYLDQLVNILLEKSKDSSLAISSNSIQAIGDLATVVGEAIEPYIDDCMKLIIEILQDSSNSFRKKIALTVLAQLAKSSSYVIDPLLNYPGLLNIVLNIIKSPSSTDTKMESVRLLGVLGALDPYKYRDIEVTSNNPIKNNTQTSSIVDSSFLILGLSPSSESYYPTVAVRILAKLLDDPAYSTHHTVIVQTAVNIIKSMGIKSAKFLDVILPSVLSVLRSSPPSMVEFYLQQLGTLISIVKAHIKPFVADIFVIIKKVFSLSNLQNTVISVIESISKSLSVDFKIYIPSTLSIFLKFLECDKTPNRKTSIRILKSLIALGSNLENYGHLILPTVTRMTEYSSTYLRKSAIITLGKLAKIINLHDMSSRIIQSLLRSLATKEKEIIKASMNTICLLLLQMNTNFIVYIPIINKTLLNNRIQHSIYDQLANKLLNNEPLPTSIIFDKDESDSKKDASYDFIDMKVLRINENALKDASICNHLKTKETWIEWFRKFSIELLKESPSPALRACSSLVTLPYALSKELFNVSFSSCWDELSTDSQYVIIDSLCTALSSRENPSDIHQSLLSLVEYMERNGKSLPIATKKLGDYAQSNNSYAKALYYKELEFKDGFDPNIIESLMNINNKLHQTDAAIGLLKYAQTEHSLQLKETWYEKLQRWEDALGSYNEREKQGDHSIEVITGRMRSLYALGKWEELSSLIDVKWDSFDKKSHISIAPLAAGASWVLHQWDKMEHFSNILPSSSPDKEFYKAVLSIHRNNFFEAESHFGSFRNLLVDSLSSLSNESYSRAYSQVVKAQMITELEEIIEFKKLPFDSPNRKQIRKTWNKRLFGVQNNVDIWWGILQTRSLVEDPKENLNVWIQFADLCRKSGRMGLAKDTLDNIIDSKLSINALVKTDLAPSLIYEKLKYTWTEGDQDEALKGLSTFIAKLVQKLGLDPKNIIDGSSISIPLIEVLQIQEINELLSRCFIRQGQWIIKLDSNWINSNSDTVLSSYLLATHFNPSSYQAWHNWALANFEVISSKLAKNDSESIPLGGSKYIRDGLDVHFYASEPKEYNDLLIHRHVRSAIKGFFHSISLSDSSSLQDALRLLTLWFTFGGIPEATQEISEGFNMTSMSTWLEVLPQLISRIHQPNSVVSRSLLWLLSDLGKAHPQALVYPLTVAIKSESVSRRNAAQSIIDSMKLHSPVLVEQANLVSSELIRVAVLWHEQWYEGLEEASKFYFSENNIEKMIEIINQLHKLLEDGPETLREISFQNAYGRDLKMAHKWIKKYQSSGDVSNINQAWDIYYSIFRKISKLLPQLTVLDLHNVSPRLLNCHDLQLAIPGIYTVNDSLIKITSFEPKFTVISSKQRPRKFTVKGSNGLNYQFALKGHEDIRQDSLVMQLFGLVNTLLQDDKESYKRHLNIRRFSAIPLSPRTGLIGWVSNSDTFHSLIKEHREQQKVPLNIEHWVMLQMAPDYDNLTLLQKIEVFTYSMENTKGDDLAQVLWLKSRSSEAWLDRRNMYTRSLAVMSMVGYILGLGDRHPSNLMLDRTSGQVVHIDFGDCFESTILREKFPEKVPFRLTRMLRNAMEVSGIEGNFRITCEHVMRVLRDNKESLMAILEAFAFDPLIDWGTDLPIEKIISAQKNSNGSNWYGTNSSMSNVEATTFHDRSLKLETSTNLKNIRAALVLKRIDDKLTGNDMGQTNNLTVIQQVDHLIIEATEIKNLCQHYIGWCPFW